MAWQCVESNGVSAHNLGGCLSDNQHHLSVQSQRGATNVRTKCFKKAIYIDFHLIFTKILLRDRKNFYQPDNLIVSSFTHEIQKNKRWNFFFLSFEEQKVLFKYRKNFFWGIFKIGKVRTIFCYSLDSIPNHNFTRARAYSIRYLFLLKMTKDNFSSFLFKCKFKCKQIHYTTGHWSLTFATLPLNTFMCS